MMLRTGNNRAFTLLEVMVTTAILSLGALFVYEAFFVCLDSFNYCSDYLSAALWMDEKIWQAQQTIGELGPKARIVPNGKFVQGDKSFTWSLSPTMIDSAGIKAGLYRVDLTITWREGRRTINLRRTAYARYEAA